MEGVVESPGSDDSSRIGTEKDWRLELVKFFGYSCSHTSREQGSLGSCGHTGGCKTAGIFFNVTLPYLPTYYIETECSGYVS